jgi:ribulose-5-phosphate 4-epimerase/fuculose-1-phosphate aldolase
MSADTSRLTTEELAAIRSAQTDLTAALRMAFRLGLSEGICNHFSVLVPGFEQFCCINPQGLHWSEITPSDILVLDSDENLVLGKHTVEPSAFFIHLRIHRAHPRAKCVMHVHAPYSTTITALAGGRLEPISQNALRFYGKVAYDDRYNGLAVDDSEGDRMAACLGDASILFLANHGVIVCDDSVAAAFDNLYYLERACYVQVLAMSTGKPLRSVPDEVAAMTVSQIDKDRSQMRFHLEALKRLLDRDEPGWRAG